MTVTATAADDVGVTSVQFLLDGAPLGAADDRGAVPSGVADHGATNGAHTLTAVARDAAGHETTATAVIVNVRNDTGGADGGADESVRGHDGGRRR